MRRTHYVVLLTIAAAFTAAAADETAARLGKAATVLSAMTASAHDIQAKIARADCIGVIPGFKKGAIVVGIGGGRGFISCRNGRGWSAPGAVTLESGSVGVQIGGEEIDIVVLSLDPARRAKLASSRFTIGDDASAAWGNGKSAHDDPNAKVIFYANTKGAFAGFDLDGLTLKPDISADKALYGKEMSNQEIVRGGVAIPPAASALIGKLTQSTHP
jgi:lipid-binding SYLF domain-containing protein